ncbi:MAG: GntP family permease [Acidobacteriota bacterium]|nr:MAG: GntP family permease [Acidobacteriota bacterium]
MRLVPVFSLLCALVLLIASITWFRIHAVLALVLAAILMGTLTGMPLVIVTESFLTGFGETLKWIGMIIVLGAAIGEVLKQTGASFRIADGVLKLVGEKRLPLAMTGTGYLISIPTFSDVAYILMKPVTDALASRSGRGILVVGLSLVAGLLASHALLPPTPGPLAAAGILGAEIGRVILINIPVALFAAGGGLLWAVLYCRKYQLPYDTALQEREQSQSQTPEGERQPNLAFSILPILLPLILIAAGAFVEGSSEDRIAALIEALGTPLVALLIGFGAAVILLRRKDWGASALEKGIQRSAAVILITGAGGGFGAVIKASGIGPEIASAMDATHLPGLLLPFLLAATLTTATGSTTVAMVTASSVVAPLLGSLDLSPEIAVALVGTGATCVIHANASLFWLLSRLHEVPPVTLYRTFSLQSLVMGGAGFAAVLLLRLLGVH